MGAVWVWALSLYDAQGLGVVRDVAAAHALLLRAAQQGDAVAQEALAALNWAELTPVT